MSHSARIAGALALAMASLSCSDSSGPRVGTVPAYVTVLSGVAPSGYAAGTTIATPIVIRVTDNSGLPVPDIQLAFNTTGGGWISTDPVTTDFEGIARMHWVLGREAGPNSLLISVASIPSIHTEVTTTSIAGAIAFLFMGPPAATVAQGSTLQLVANAADANFNVVQGAAISWTSSNPTAVSVSTSGLVTAAAPGNAIVTATTHGNISAANLVVVPVPAGPNGPGIPAFTMAISSYRDFGITVARSDGTVESNISCGTQCSFLAGPNWSRDGRKLALTGRRDTLSVLFVVNRDGTDLHEVASAPRLFISPPTNSAYWTEFREDWSADGRLVYVRSTLAGSAIETIAADGTGRTTVMASTGPIRTPANLNGVTNPRWGLGDSMISAEIGGQIHSMNPDGSNLRQLTSLTIGAFDHRWSPDGKTIAFWNTTQSQGVISVLDPVSGSLRQIVVPALRSFCWAPNSSGFSMVSLDTPQPNWSSIYTVNLDGSGLRTAVTAIMERFSANISGWSPDGGFLVYMDDREFAGGPAGAQLYAQSLGEGTNTRIADARNVIFFSIAETRGCGRNFPNP